MLRWQEPAWAAKCKGEGKLTKQRREYSVRGVYGENEAVIGGGGRTSVKEASQ